MSAPLVVKSAFQRTATPTVGLFYCKGEAHRFTLPIVLVCVLRKGRNKHCVE